MTVTNLKGPTREIVSDLYEKLFNRIDRELLNRYVAEDYIYRNPFQDTVGRQQIIDLIAAQHEAFREYYLHADEIVIDTEMESVAVSWTMTGIFEKPFFGYEPTGRNVKFTGITMMKWKNGKAILGWGFSDIHEKLGGSGV